MQSDLEAQQQDSEASQRDRARSVFACSCCARGCYCPTSQLKEEYLGSARALEVAASTTVRRIVDTPDPDRPFSTARAPEGPQRRHSPMTKDACQFTCLFSSSNGRLVDEDASSSARVFSSSWLAPFSAPPCADAKLTVLVRLCLRHVRSSQFETSVPSRLHGLQQVRFL